ncbi:MAG: hypothetical protein ABIJ43_04705 [Candidatus Beckwithbacteria bacterium]|nr:hypothetical protein [Patescibacteria group bacterium]
MFKLLEGIKQNKKLIFLTSWLLLGILVSIFIIVKNYIVYEIIKKPKYESVCLVVDYDCLSKCNEIDNISYSGGAKKRCEFNERDHCCIENTIVKRSLKDLIINDLKFWVPVSLFGIGIFISVFITNYFSDKTNLS